MFIDSFSLQLPFATFSSFIDLQVHGIVNETIDFVKGVLTTEINSATDNPVSFVVKHTTFM